MNAEIGVLLQLMPFGGNIKKGKGYDNMIGCAVDSLSQHLI